MDEQPRGVEGGPGEPVGDLAVEQRRGLGVAAAPAEHLHERGVPARQRLEVLDPLGHEVGQLGEPTLLGADREQLGPERRGARRQMEAFGDHVRVEAPPLGPLQVAVEE